METVEEPAENEGKKPLKYSKEMVLALAQAASKFKGYIINSDSMEVKWIKIVNELKKQEAFKSSADDLIWRTVYAKFKRTMNDCLLKYGMTKEGANLSGLDEEPDQITSLLLSMAEENAESLKEIEDKNKKNMQSAPLLVL